MLEVYWFSRLSDHKHWDFLSNIVVDWDSMGRVITQTRSRVFQTLGQVFQILGRAFSFLLNPQKLGQLFEKLG